MRCLSTLDPAHDGVDVPIRELARQGRWGEIPAGDAQTVNGKPVAEWIEGERLAEVTRRAATTAGCVIMPLFSNSTERYNTALQLGLAPEIWEWYDQHRVRPRQ